MGVLMSWVNLADAATVTASSSATDLGTDGLLTSQVNDVWRSGTLTSTTAYVDCDLGAAATVNVVAIAAPRDGVLPSAACTIQLMAGPTQGSYATLDTVAATFTLSPWGVWGWRSVAGVSARWWRVAFVGGVADTYVQLGRLWVGAATVTTRSYAYGTSRGGRDPGAATRTGVTGTRYVTRGRPYRFERIGLPYLTSAEATSVESMAAAVGTTGQVFVARDDSSLASGIFGAFADPPTVTRANYPLYATDLQIEDDA